jgi:hypothetical protein
MRRRRFIALTGLGTAGVLAGCSRSFTIASIVDDGGVPTDAPLSSDASRTADTGTAAFVIAAAFTVRLNDVSCSGHDHECRVDAGAYDDDTPIEFNAPGSHTVAFRPSELARLAAGAQLPFATVGPGPGHGHCGMAWRADLLPEPSTDRVDSCTTATPAGAPPAVCTQHPAT